jgi:hypothetical protein
MITETLTVDSIYLKMVITKLNAGYYRKERNDSKAANACRDEVFTG